MAEQLVSSNHVLEEAKVFLGDNPGFSDLSSLKCISCSGEYPSKPEPYYKCVKLDTQKRVECGNILDVTYQFDEIDPDKTKTLWLLRRLSEKPEDRSGVWRFRELLPFIDSPENIVTLGEGNTPLLEAPVCAGYIGLPRLLIKHQGFNPTGSFKDPGMSAAISQAKAMEMKAVACASTGNTSASMAAYAERAGLLPIVFIPEGQIAYGKLSQSLDYGALTIQVNGDFDKAMDLVMEVAPETGVYVVNSINPFRIEGQKTMIMELLEQMDWNVPDRIVVPGGNLGNASSVGKAFHELRTLGFIERTPKITVVQASGADPLYRTITSDDSEHLITVHARTLASAIKIGSPISWKKAKRSIEESDGWVTEVTEQEIADAKAMIGREGIGSEPASAVTIAGLKRVVSEGTDKPFDKDEVVVAILTGNVLKDADYTVNYHSDNLYEDYVTSSRIIRKGKKIVSNYRNSPIQVEPDARVIKKIIQEKLEERGLARRT